jgi:hypothetical protein
MGTGFIRMQVKVFHEFTGKEVLAKYCSFICPSEPTTFIQTEGEESRRITCTNIKIFFGNDKDAAYTLKEKLEADGVAKFVTDQLYIKEKRGDETITIALPKDRIVMELL